MSLYQKVRGTIETIFQLGLGGPQLKANGGAIETRNAADNAMAVHRGLDPVGLTDFTTKLYVDQVATRTIVVAQADGSVAIPNNTGVERFLVVSTSGVNANIGDLLFDNGTGSGVMTKLAAAARGIITTVALSGGTVTFAADSQYFWDTVAVAWINIGGTAISGARRVIQYAITNAATQDSVAKIPANATVRTAHLDITTPFSGGATISIGQPGSLTLLQLTTDNLATVAGQYEVPQRTPWGGSAQVVRATVAGAPAAGAGTLTVEYTVPDA